MNLKPQWRPVPHAVSCELCGVPTQMTGTRRCDRCWQIERTVERDPELARRILAHLPRPDLGAPFRTELGALLNQYSQENGSNTPDFILASYLVDCLRAFDAAVDARERWYGRGPTPVPTEMQP